MFQSDSDKTIQNLMNKGKKNGLNALLLWLKFSAILIYAHESGAIFGIKLGCDHQLNKKPVKNKIMESIDKFLILLMMSCQNVDNIFSNDFIYLITNQKAILKL